MSSTPPIPHPDWESLLTQRDALQLELAAILTDMQSLNKSRSVVLGRYSAAFGDRLIRLHRLEIEAASLKREIELVQAAINQGREVDFGEIQRTLESEFAEWNARVEGESKRLNHDRRVLDHLLPDATVRALRDAFRLLARRLHPDWHPGQSSADAALWHRATAAYNAQDLPELQALEILTRNSTDTRPASDSMEDLRHLIGTLREHLTRQLAKLETARGEWPFDQLPLLDDPAATRTRQEELDARIAEADALRGGRRQWLDRLLGG